MQWSDEAILLSSRPYGENSHIVQCFTPSHGRHAGLVRGKTMRALLQPGHLVQASWNARLSEHLGMMKLELLTPYATHVMQDAAALLALSSLTALVETCLPERDPHPRLYHHIK